MFPHRWTILRWFLLFGMILGACSPAPAETAGDTQAEQAGDPAGIENVQSSFTEEDCEFEGNELFKGRIVCGKLTVPEERGNPDSPRLDLRVVVFKSTGETPESDPIFITFGPFNAGFTFFFGYSQLWGGYLDQRDLVILDPRGTGRSGTSLECPELGEAYLETLELDFNSQAVKDILVESHQTCHRRGESLVSDIGSINLVEMAQDFEDLRLALHYGAVNVQSWGFGTRIAEIWAGNHPDSIRTLTVISPIPLQDNLYGEQVKSVDRSIQTIFEECAADKNCAKAFPNLGTLFPQLIADLNAHPLKVEVNYLDEGTHYTMRLNGDRLLDLAYVMATSTYADWIGYLPQVLYETKAGNTAPVAEALNTYINFTRPTGAPFSQGIWCQEILNADAQASIQAEILAAPTAYQNYLEGAMEMNQAICEVWGERENQPEKKPAVPIPVPVLILASETDLVSPAEIATQMTREFAPAFIYEFAGGGGVQSVQWWDCWSKLQTAFMSDPSVPPQEGCLQKPATISWITFKP